MKSRNIIRAVAGVAAIALLALLAPLSAAGVPSVGTPSWTTVTIPGLAADSQATFLWAPQPGSLYVWVDGIVAGTTSVPEATLFQLDRGSWSEQLRLPGFASSAVYGTGVGDVFAAAAGCPRTTETSCAPGPSSVMYHFDGSTWAEQALPPEAAAGTVGQISGFPGNVQAAVIGANLIISYDGSAWTVAFGPTGPGQVGPQQMTLVGPDEGYYVGCIGFGWWDGATWAQSASYTFCDVYDLWGVRDEMGVATVYAVGNQGFSNGPRVWRGDEQAAVPPLNFTDAFALGDSGSAYGVWGSGASDVYAVGRLGSGAGTILHFDGLSWGVVDVGSIATARDVWGSGPDDVWVSLADGTLLHFGITYQFSGFNPPVRDALNTVKAGQSVPIKFSLAGESTTDVLAAGSPSSRPIACDGYQPGTEVPATSAGGRGLTFDLSAGQYSFVWKTEKSWAGSCREFILRLDDGSAHSALFRLK